MEDKEFILFVESLGLKYFSAAELSFLGDSNYNPKSRAYAKNHLPRRELWGNIVPTIKALEILRERLNAPIVIISGYRSPEYNKAIGGARYSQHIYYKALDFRVKSNSAPEDWANELKAMRSEGLFKGGLGVYPTFVHIDTRDDDANW